MYEIRLMRSTYLGQVALGTCSSAISLAIHHQCFLFLLKALEAKGMKSFTHIEVLLKRLGCSAIFAFTSKPNSNEFCTVFISVYFQFIMLSLESCNLSIVNNPQ